MGASISFSCFSCFGAMVAVADGLRKTVVLRMDFLEEILFDGTRNEEDETTRLDTV